MIKVKKESILPSPSNNLIEKIQKYYRIHLPKEYIDFIKENNGAIPENGEFIFQNHEYFLERFLCLLDNEEREIFDDVSWSEMRVTITELDERLVDDENLVGMNIIPIAVLFAGDYICFDYRKNEKKPSICIWYHEESEDFSPITKKIADNFEKFLELFDI